MYIRIDEKKVSFYLKFLLKFVILDNVERKGEHNGLESTIEYAE